jgi:hypothetical protein
MAGQTRTDQRRHLEHIYRIERLEEDADTFEEAVARVMQRLNWLIGLVFTLTVAIFTALITITTR